MAYPVSFNIERPEEFDKAQIALRILIIIVVGWMINSVIGAAYWALPIIAAVLISQKGGERYLAEAESGPTLWLRYIMGFYSYIALASDELPMDRPERVNLNIQPTGTPTVGSALLRIILVIPHVIVLGLLSVVFFFLWIVAAVSILLNDIYPDWVFDFIRGFLRWNARVLAYMASLVDEYPPFSFENGGGAAPEAGPAEPPAETPALPEGSDEGSKPND